MLWLVTCLFALLAACYFLFYKEHSSSGTSRSAAQSDYDSNADINSRDGEDAYLVVADSDVGKYSRTYTTPGRQVLVVFGTEYGFSEEVARYVFDKLIDYDNLHFNTVQCERLQPRLVNAKHYESVNWSKEEAILFVVSTTGNGVPPTNAQGMFDHLTKQTAADFSHISYSVLALGETHYVHFCRAGIMLDSILEDLGAHRVVERCEIDGDDWAAISVWTKEAVAAIGQLTITVKQDYFVHVSDKDDGYDKNRPFMALVARKYDLTERSCGDHYSKSDKETLHIDFDLTGSGLTYVPGDALGIYPRNSSANVERLITAMRCHGNEAVPILLSCRSPRPESLNLREALVGWYDIKSAKPELLQQIVENKCDESVKSHLLTLLENGVSKQNTKLWSYLHEREVADVLEECLSSPISPPTLLACLRPLQPRYYSISSCPNWASGIASVCASWVRYEVGGISRTGVATTFLRNCVRVGSHCPVFVSKNPDFRLPEDKSRSIIMIGPGTGIAAFRSFIQERLLTKASGLNVLYFGCRHQHQDYLYRSELEQWASEMHIILRTAFSRDQSEKVYVQDLLIKDADMVFRLLQNGCYVYVSGDARRMAIDVHKVLQVILRQSGLSEEEAEKYLDELEVTHRYQRDVWAT